MDNSTSRRCPTEDHQIRSGDRNPSVIKANEKKKKKSKCNKVERKEEEEIQV
jgi:hypothetical protein